MAGFVRIRQVESRPNLSFGRTLRLSSDRHDLIETFHFRITLAQIVSSLQDFYRINIKYFRLVSYHNKIFF